MAETTLDKACEQLGTRRPCTTATTQVPGIEQGHYWLGHRLHEVEDHGLQGELICECELVTRTMLEQAARRNPTLTLDDLRRDVRLGMGPCQGGFCTYRAACILHEMHITHNATAELQDTSPSPVWEVAYLQSPAHNVHAAVEHAPPHANPNLLLRDFLQERWKGLTPILWGQQLKQERLDELIYQSLLNVDHLPDDGATSPLTDFYHDQLAPEPTPHVRVYAATQDGQNGHEGQAKVQDA